MEPIPEVLNGVDVRKCPRVRSHGLLRELVGNGALQDKDVFHLEVDVHRGHESGHKEEDGEEAAEALAESLVSPDTLARTWKRQLVHNLLLNFAQLIIHQKFMHHLSQLVGPRFRVPDLRFLSGLTASC